MPVGRCASCKDAESALMVTARWGELGNGLTEFSNQITMVMLQHGKQAVGNAPQYVQWSFPKYSQAIAPWVCYAPTDVGRGGRPHPLPVASVNAKTIFYAYGRNDKIFQGEEGLRADMEIRQKRIMANLFVESYLSLKKTIDPFLTANKLHGGFNAVHLRNLDGRCYKLAKVSKKHNEKVKPFLSRDVTTKDICMMTSDYIRASIKSQGGNLKLPLVLCHDHQQKEEAARIVADFKAVVYEGDANVAKKIDLLLLMRANTPVLNSGMFFSSRFLLRSAVIIWDWISRL